MKKPLCILLVLSLFLTSCSLFELEVDNEPSEEYSESSEEYNELSEEDSEPTDEDVEPREEYNEPVIFLEKHNMSVWERTDRYDPDRKIYMRILSNPNKIAEIWSTSDTNKDCYFIDLYSEVYNLYVSEDTEKSLKTSGTREMGYSIEYNFSISNDTLSENKDFGLPPDAFIEYNTWVKSKVNVDDLNLCD